jgi:hypothetical protein
MTMLQQSSARDRVSTGLSDDSRFWLIITIALGGVAFVKGLRRPNLWTATQTQFDYRFGFIRRGLFGQVLSWLDIPANHYAVFAIVAYLLLIVLTMVLIRWVWMSRVFQTIDRGTAVALFFTSYAMTYLANMVGYTDILLMAMAVIVIGIRHHGTRLAAVILAGAVGVLIHESYLIMFLPLTLLPSILTASPREQMARRSAIIAAAALIVAIITIIIALRPSMTPALRDRLQQDVQSRVDFPPRPDCFEVLLHSTRSNVLFMAHVMSGSKWWVNQIYALLVFLPAAAMLTWLSLRAIAMCYRGPYPALVRLCVLAAGCSPALMQFLGWDLYRWYALVVIDSFLVLAVISRYCLIPASSAIELSRPTRNLIVLIIALNLVTGNVGTFDGTEPFPFMGHFNFLRGLQHNHWKIPPPGR